MQVTVKTWAKNHNAASVNYGPLAFSLKIGEHWTRYGGTDGWPEWEVHPTTAWNYGLVLNDRDSARSFEVVKKRTPVSTNPFTPDTIPLELRVKAKKIPAWKMDRFGLVARLQDSPVKDNQPAETVTLIPMGAARLRISAFPVIGTGGKAYEWTQTGSNRRQEAHTVKSEDRN